MPMTAIILAAGEGTRMKSRHPKVMHKLLDRPLVSWVTRAARNAGADRIMMDNMGAPLLGQALELVPAHIEAEVSGGVTLETIRGIALTGPRHPDFISVGRLTHSAVAADFSMTLANA